MYTYLHVPSHPPWNPPPSLRPLLFHQAKSLPGFVHTEGTSPGHNSNQEEPSSA